MSGSLACEKCDMCKRDDCPSLTHITFEIFDTIKDAYEFITKHICINCQSTIFNIIGLGHYQKWGPRGFSEVDQNHPMLKISQIMEDALLGRI